MQQQWRQRRRKGCGRWRVARQQCSGDTAAAAGEAAHGEAEEEGSGRGRRGAGKGEGRWWLVIREAATHRGGAVAGRPAAASRSAVAATGEEQRRLRCVGPAAAIGSGAWGAGAWRRLGSERRRGRGGQRSDGRPAAMGPNPNPRARVWHESVAGRRYSSERGWGKGRGSRGEAIGGGDWPEAGHRSREGWRRRAFGKERESTREERRGGGARGRGDAVAECAGERQRQQLAQVVVAREMGIGSNGARD